MRETEITKSHSMEQGSLQLKFKGQNYGLSTDFASLAEFAEEVAKQTGAQLETIKLSVPGRKLLRPADLPNSTLEAAGIKAGMRLLLIGSTQAEVEAVRNSRDLPGLAGFDHELKTLADRRQQASQTAPVQLPSGLHTFAQYEVWQLPELRPPPSEALKLLHKLAADRGIAGIMEKHGWRVGKLSEMPPEGKVGVSPVCVLGVNINAGQEISLRLRTDDLQGFRRYLSIRQTLCHELAHMVFGEHDLNFKRLNSQLCRECEQMGSTPGVQLFEAAEGWTLDVPAGGPSDVMAATAFSSGRTLRQLAGSAALPVGTVPPAVLSSLAQAAEEAESAALGVQALGHHDAVTEAKEHLADRLGSLPADHQAIWHEDAAASQGEMQLPLPSSAAAETQAEQPAGLQDKLMEADAAQQQRDAHEQHSSADQIAQGNSGQSNTQTSGSQLNASASSALAQATAAAHQAGNQAQRARPEATVEPSSNPAGTDVEELGGGSSEVDPSMIYLRNAQTAVQKLIASTDWPAAEKALQTLATILKNALSKPDDPKYRKVRQHNPAFHTRAGRHPGSVELLRAAGFVPENDGQEEVLRLSRNDPGLLWITLSACEGALYSIVKVR